MNGGLAHPEHDALLAELGEVLEPAAAEPGIAERAELRGAVLAHFGDRSVLPANGAAPRVVRIPARRPAIARLAPRLTGVAAAAVVAVLLATTPTNHLPEPLRTIARYFSS